MNVQCDRCGTQQEIQEENRELPVQCQRCGHVFIPSPGHADEETIVLQEDDSDIFALSDSFERDSRIAESSTPNASSLGDMLFLGGDLPEPTGIQPTVPELPGYEQSFDPTIHPDFNHDGNPRSDALRLPGAPVTRPFEPPPPPSPATMARGMLGVPPPKPPMMAEPPPEPTKVGILLNALISLLALTALFAGIVRVTFNLEPPADRARVEKLTAALTGPNSPQSDVQGLRINDIKATLYPQPAGTNILVIHGKLSSSRVDLVDNVHVTTTLVTPEGKELSSISGPVGLTFSPYELAHFNQDLSMATILESRVGEPIGDVPPQTTTSWMVIAESPSVDASTLSYRVVLKEQEPPAPSSVGQPAPSVQKGEAVDVDTGLPDESGQEPAQ